MKAPPVQYADGPEGRVAYQVVGEGPIDLLFMPFPARWNLDVVWDYPPLERYLRRLASFSRLILYQARGTGISDPVPGPTATIEDQAQDARLVLDAIGSERAAVLAIEAGSVPAILFAATFPERTVALALVEGVATMERADDYPWGMPPSAQLKYRDAMAREWGTGLGLDYMAPHRSREAALRDWWARLERLSQSAHEISLAEWRSWDVRGILPNVNTPTLVISHAGVPWIRLGHGSYVADHIAGARYVERAGPWGVYWVDDMDWTLEEVQAFFTGTRVIYDVDDRVLATVLFTDIVGSTAEPLSWATAAGRISWMSTTPSPDGRSSASAGASSSRREMDAWRRSTVRRGRSVARSPWGMLCTHSDLRFGPVFMWARWNCEKMMSVGSRCTSPSG